MRCCLSVCFGFPHYTVGFRFCTSANVLQQLKAAFWHLIGGPLSLATPVGRSYKYQWWCPDSAREETASFAYRSWHRRRAPYIEAYKKSRGGGRRTVTVIRFYCKIGDFLKAEVNLSLKCLFVMRPLSQWRHSHEAVKNDRHIFGRGVYNCI